MRSVMQYWEPERPLEPKDYDLPVCPVCGEETDTYYKNKDGVIVGFDSGKTQIDAIKAGKEAGAVTQSPQRMGELTVKAAIAALNGAELPTVINSGFAWYDKSNIDTDAIKANLYE